MDFFSFNVAAKCDQVEADKGMSLAMQQCAEAEFEKSDVKLNRIYKGIIDHLKKLATEASGKENAEAMLADLRAAQRDWVEFRVSVKGLAAHSCQTQSMRLESFMLYALQE